MLNGTLNQSRIAFVTLLLLLGAQLATAQVSLGLRAGPTLSKVDFVESDLPFGFTLNERYRTGFMLAVPLEVRLPGPFALQLEAAYTQFSDRVLVDGTLFDLNELRSRTDYLHFPILFKAGFIGSGFEVSALAGPTLGYGLVRRVFEGDELVIDAFGDEQTRSRIGAVVGTQIGIPVAGGKLIADARFNYGLNRFAYGTSAVGDARSHQFSVGLGYLWNL